MVQGISGAYSELSALELTEIIPRLLNHPDLSERDVCSDAIPGTVAQRCVPGNTLCCVPEDKSISFPQCQEILTQGFCCVDQANCYIDMVSDCAAPNSVQCSELAPGTDEACCPAFTSCLSNFNQSASAVRCSIAQITPNSSEESLPKTLLAQISSSPSTPTELSETSAILQTSTPSSSVLSIGPLTSSSQAVTSLHASSKPISGAAGVGIGIATIVGLLAFVACGIWLYRKGQVSQERAYRRRLERIAARRDQEAAQSGASVRPTYEEGFKYAVKYNSYDHPGDYPIQIAELMGSAPDNMMI